MHQHLDSKRCTLLQEHFLPMFQNKQEQQGHDSIAAASVCPDWTHATLLQYASPVVQASLHSVCQFV